MRTMIRQEVDLAVEWAANEGWNPGINDANCFYSADPNGFIIGLLNDEPIATISAVKYGDSFGFLGFYIVKPEYRGNGYGIQVWNAGIKYLENRNIGLDGVVAQQDNYKNSGFKFAHRNIRYEGYGGNNIPQSGEVVNLITLPFETIVSYDRLFFPEARTQFIRSWINQADSNALGVMQNGKLAGYGIVRKCRLGYKIGPLFADNPELAEVLFQSLKSNINSGEPFYLDTPEVNPAAVELAERN
ncbi:MAG: GNAT family N-acetyltransferase, partial [Gammaproteobacteria bacterium]|nr:GNAT family N-acetyltransferase [Gammaproteobacteria bacterium]